MALRVLCVRVLQIASLSVLVPVAALFLTVQGEQWLLRYRAQRLSMDIHEIRLYQSTWTDAQRLMNKWGAWGHYDGSCTAASCKYEIEMDSISHNNPRIQRHVWLDWLLIHDRFNLYQWFGGRSSAFYTSFTVHDGTIWRESTTMGISVPRRRKKRYIGPDTNLELDDFDKTLSVGAVSYQRLHRTLENPFVFMGGDEQLDDHPYYKVGRPGGCMINCQIGVVYFSTHTPAAEIERLTSYNFSCFTRFHACAELEDLLPAAKEWHLYKEDETGLREAPCGDIPAWAQARDARYVLSVEALSTNIVKSHEDYGEYHHEVAKVRIISSLKEPAPWLPGAIVTAHLLNWLNYAVPFDRTEYLIPGRRYIVFAIGNDQRDQIVSKDSPLRFERCGVREDTPEIRRELEKGFAQNDGMNP
jgi:hypothetical protein